MMGQIDKMDPDKMDPDKMEPGKMDQSCDWPYVLKPRWIHDSLLLWRRKHPYELYLDQIADYTVREVRDKAMRRRCAAWIAEHFAPQRAGATLNQNVWASYGHHFQCNDLAAAYLAHLILCEPLARQATTVLHGVLSGSSTLGTAIGRSTFSALNALPGALEAWLRTLLQWQVLAADPRKGGYLVDRRLCVPVQTFPLLVWAWWLDRRQSSIALDDFAEVPLWVCFEKDGFSAGWQAYLGRLWTLETEGGEPTIFLHPTDTASFTRSLLNLLSTDGRRGRQLPRHERRGEGLADAASLREGILGR